MSIDGLANEVVQFSDDDQTLNDSRQAQHR